MTERAGLWGTLSGKSVPLLGVEVHAEVVAGHARAVVKQRYRNEEAHPIEAIYTFPLPSKGVLSGFAMSVDGRRLEGEVHEREEAFQRYDDAITAGHGAALLEQERPNVFTANVGNLLPGEETVIEITYVEPVKVDEGAIRWSIPTLVAPRYIPGAPGGDRTAHGTAQPTSRVPDADRISPPIGDVRYGLSLEVTFDVGNVDISSPSHAVAVVRDGERVKVTFAQRDVPLDRDVVIVAAARDKGHAAVPLAAVLAHREKEGEVGTFALTIVPDLAGAEQRRATRTDVVFVLDRSGSMEGDAMSQARLALKMCLRQLREGDRFGILAFDTEVDPFDDRLLPLTARHLAQADAFIDGIHARGGTELLAPMLRATEMAGEGIVVLLTDGQVGNEEEIERALAGRKARIFSFGIGMNVSDALLLALGRSTDGALEMIHPGERIDDKVIAQFARATAPRVTDLEIRFRGVDVGEIAPSAPRTLTDGEPLGIFGTYETAGHGTAEVRGRLDGESFFLEVPFDLPAHASRPAIPKLWAQARIRDLEQATVSGRRADAMKDRIVRLAKEHGVSSRFTSFVVVEKRTGDRRASGMPETRVVPVAPPAGWAARANTMAGSVGSARMGVMPLGAVMPAPSPAAGAPMIQGRMGAGGAARSAPPPRSPSRAATVQNAPPPAASPMAPMPARRQVGTVDHFASPRGARREADGAFEDLSIRDDGAAETFSLDAKEGIPEESVRDMLARQGADGLWGSPQETVTVLYRLLNEGIDGAHASYGRAIQKAALALVNALRDEADRVFVEAALGLAWLLVSGQRTKKQLEDEAGRRGIVLTIEVLERVHRWQKSL